MVTHDNYLTSNIGRMLLLKVDEIMEKKQGIHLKKRRIQKRSKIGKKMSKHRRNCD